MFQASKKAVQKMYDRWQGYITRSDMKKQFKKDCVEAEQQIKELEEQIQLSKSIESDLRKTIGKFKPQIKELEELLKNIGLCLEDHTESIKQALK